MLGCIPLASGKLAQSRPNDVLDTTDDQGMGDLSCMGNQILCTPHLDRFHSQSTRFTDFQVSPTCKSTRAAIMSGRFPFEVGISHTILQRERMALPIITLPQALQHPKVMADLQRKYDLWWESLGPLLINDGLGKIPPEDHHLIRLEKKQLAEGTIPFLQMKN